MPRYIYKAKNGPASTVEGELIADSEKAALARIEAMGYCPVSVREKAAGSDAQMAMLSRGRLKVRDINVFTRQMAGLIKSGVPILKTLRTAREQSQSARLQRIVTSLEDDVREGRPLSSALARFPAVFTELYVNMVRAGEAAGAMDSMLTRLADAGEKEEETRGKVKSAMAYPALVLSVGVVTVFVMLTFFMPRLVNLFRNFDELPLPTRILIAVSDFCADYWAWILVPLVLALAIIQRLTTGPRGRLAADAAKLRLPLAGGLILKSEVARFARTFSLLVEAGIPVEKGLALSAGALGNTVLREEITHVRETAVRQGLSVAEGLKSATHFPEYARSMIAVGEESGRIEETLADVARFYEQEVDRDIRTITTLIEPVLILLVGAVVGFIAFAMMMPIFAVTRSVLMQ